MDEQRQNDQKEPTYSSSVSIQDVFLKTYRKQWTIEKGGERGPGIPVLMVRHDDDDIENPYKMFMQRIKMETLEICLNLSLSH